MMKIKLVMTEATTAVIYNDGTNAILTLETIGKIGLSKAKKFFKTDYEIANAKTVEVIAVDYKPITYVIDDSKIYEFLKENGTLETEDTTEEENNK